MADLTTTREVFFQAAGVLPLRGRDAPDREQSREGRPESRGASATGALGVPRTGTRVEARRPTDGSDRGAGTTAAEEAPSPPRKRFSRRLQRADDRVSLMILLQVHLQ